MKTIKFLISIMLFVGRAIGEDAMDVLDTGQRYTDQYETIDSGEESEYQEQEPSLFNVLEQKDKGKKQQKQDKISKENIMKRAVPEQIEKDSAIKDQKEKEENIDKSAVIIALNKITAKSTRLTLKPGGATYFGNIKIQLHKCVMGQDPYNPLHTAFMTVTESSIDDDNKILLRGWIFSNDPSLSTLTHPVYEIFVDRCV